MRKLYLIRHGQTLFNQRKLTQGWCDSPLTQLGIRQAEATKKYIEDEGITFNSVYSSTSERCCDTTEIITDLPYTRLKGLKEWNFGILEGEPEDLQKSRHNWTGAVDYTHGDFFVRFEGESDLEVQTRLDDTIKEILLKDDSKSILCVTHSGAMWTFFLKRNHPEDLNNEPFGNCCMLEYDVNENNELTFIRVVNPARDTK